MVFLEQFVLYICLFKGRFAEMKVFSTNNSLIGFFEED